MTSDQKYSIFYALIAGCIVALSSKVAYGIAIFYIIMAITTGIEASINKVIKKTQN